MARYKIDWNERNPENFQMVKKTVRRLKRYRGAITHRAPNGQF